MHTFVCSTRLYFGENALQALESLGAKRVFLVTDPFFTKNGTVEQIVSHLPDAQVQIFEQIRGEPTLSLVAEGVRRLHETEADTVLALGGGSAIDCAKGILSLSQSAARLIAIPTTSGTGSEVTSFAILTHEGVKHPLIEENIRPQAAILDDSLLRGLPRGLIADAGMDVLAHCLEAIAAKNASAFTTAFASAAFRMVLERLTASYQGDLSVRGEIHQAATMAGIAFDNAGLGICHALSHALGGAFHLAHGRLNAILLPHVLRFNAQAVPVPYAALASFCGLAGPNGLVFAIRRLRRRLELPASLTAAGLERGDVLAKADSLCRAALEDPCAASNPRPVTLEDLHSLLQAAL